MKMNKIFNAAFLLFLLTSAIQLNAVVPSDFYNDQQNELNNFNQNRKQILPLIEHKVFPVTASHNLYQAMPEIKTDQLIKVDNPEQLVSLVLKHDPEIKQKTALVKAAQFGVSQTLALEPVIRQFSTFLTKARINHA